MGLIQRRALARLKSIVPGPAKEHLKRRMRKGRIGQIRAVAAPVSLDVLRQAFLGLGLHPGMTVFTHSAADWLRAVDVGPVTAIRLLLDILGPDGTLAMPSFPMDGLASDYVRDQQFDLRRSPSKMGLVTEIFRRMPGVLRSLHPTHPVCALGPLAPYLTEAHHLDPRPFGPCSPFGRLEQVGGKLLMIGVDTTVLTHVHVIEDELGPAFPDVVYSTSLAAAEVIDAEGTRRRMDTYVHDPMFSRLKNITQFEAEWLRTGVMQWTVVGHLALRLLDAQLLSDDLRARARRGETIYR